MITPVLSILCLAAVAHADPFEVAFEASDKPKAVWAIDADGRVVLPTAVDERPEPIALAIVYCGWEMWIGNDDYIPHRDSSQYPGVLHGLEAAIDEVPWSRIGPPGSKAVIIKYADGAKLVAAPRPLTELRGSLLGVQKDYYGTTGLDLASGLDLATAQLTAMPQPKKLVLVVGDGESTDLKGGQLATVAQDLAKRGIEVRSLVRKAHLSGPQDQIGKYAKRARFVRIDAEMGPAMTSLLLPAEHRFVATFPQFFDGARLYVDGVDELTIEVPHGCQFASERTPWYPFVLVGVALLGILALMIRDRAAAA